MIRLTDLPQAIQTAINGWRVWVTLALFVSLILNEAVIGMRSGQTLTGSLTRTPFYLIPYLLLVSGAIAQAGIGAVPFAIGVIMTLYDAVIKRRQGWRQEGVEEGRAAGLAAGFAGGRAEGRREEHRAKIAAILAHPDLSDEEKVRFIAILNSDSPTDVSNPD